MTRAVRVFAVVLSAVVLFASVGGYAVVTWFNGSISRVHLNLGSHRPAKAAAGDENWLLVGTDSGAGTDGEYGPRSGQRSDTTILVHLDADGTTTNVSFPRDTLVTIPEHVSAGKTVPAKKAKFNAAIELGGPSLLIRTVELLTKIQIDHFVSVDLEGFKKISEAINGVDVCILHDGTVYDSEEPDAKTKQPIYHHDTNINDSYSGFHGKDGPQKVVGEQALAFVRQRHGLPHGDLDRIQRQQQFLGSVFRTATNGKVLFDPARVLRLIVAIQHALTLDENTSLTDLEKLALRLKGVDPRKVRFETIPQHGLALTDSNLGSVVEEAGLLVLYPTGLGGEDLGNVQVLDQAPFEAMMAAIGGGTGSVKGANPRAKKAPAVASVALSASQVFVTVQNGVGRASLAGEVTRALGGQGFRTGAPGPADSTGYARSEVRYGASYRESAQTVAAAIPGSVTKLDPSVTGGVVLVVGANYSGVRLVTTTPLPTPQSTSASSPVPSASPTIAPVTADSAANRCTF
jgi:LCP family protein required for cell wall assembly